MKNKELENFHIGPYYFSVGCHYFDCKDITIQCFLGSWLQWEDNVKGDTLLDAKLQAAKKCQPLLKKWDQEVQGIFDQACRIVR